MSMKKSQAPRKNSVVLSRAKFLVNTSVQDMQSGIHTYWSREDLRVLSVGLIIVRKRGEKTKAGILERKIKAIRKDIGLR